MQVAYIWDTWIQDDEGAWTPRVVLNHAGKIDTSQPPAADAGGPVLWFEDDKGNRAKGRIVPGAGLVVEPGFSTMEFITTPRTATEIAMCRLTAPESVFDAIITENVDATTAGDPTGTALVLWRQTMPTEDAPEPEATDQEPGAPFTEAEADLMWAWAEAHGYAWDAARALDIIRWATTNGIDLSALMAQIDPALLQTHPQIVVRAFALSQPRATFAAIVENYWKTT